MLERIGEQKLYLLIRVSVSADKSKYRFDRYSMKRSVGVVEYHVNFKASIIRFF